MCPNGYIDYEINIIEEGINTESRKGHEDILKIMEFRSQILKIKAELKE
jgi:hypothetical protein